MNLSLANIDLNSNPYAGTEQTQTKHFAIWPLRRSLLAKGRGRS
jgi:hypothetical protein